MRQFADLYTRLDETAATRAKVAAMRDYFAAAPPAAAAWAVSFVCGRRVRRLIPGPRLRPWVAAAAALPLWPVEESYLVVGDSAETITLLPDQIATGDEGLDVPLRARVEERILPLRQLGEAAQKQRLFDYGRQLPTAARFALHRLLTGPVRAAAPARVFELHFEGIQASRRHKPGIAVSFPLIARWRTDGPLSAADSLAGGRVLLPAGTKEEERQS